MEDSYGSLALTSEYINDQALPKEVRQPPGSALATQILRSVYLPQLRAATKHQEPWCDRRKDTLVQRVALVCVSL